MKEATLQVRMDAALKTQAEELFRELGTSFAEAVRIFAHQCIAEGAMPFVIRLPLAPGTVSLRGAATRYANPKLRGKEKDAFRAAREKKHADHADIR